MAQDTEAAIRSCTQKLSKAKACLDSKHLSGGDEDAKAFKAELEDVISKAEAGLETAKGKQKEIATKEVMLRRGFSQDLTKAMFEAVEKNDTKALGVILEDPNVEIEAKNEGGVTPLLWASANGNKEVVRLLLEAKANAENDKKNTETPLHWALKYSHKEVIGLLLEAKANTEATTVYGETPLRLASSAGYVGKEVVRLLLEAKANTENADVYGRTPLHRASAGGNKEVVRQIGRAHRLNSSH